METTVTISKSEYIDILFLLNKYHACLCWDQVDGFNVKEELNICNKMLNVLINKNKKK